MRYSRLRPVIVVVSLVFVACCSDTSSPEKNAREIIRKFDRLLAEKNVNPNQYLKLFSKNLLYSVDTYPDQGEQNNYAQYKRYYLSYVRNRSGSSKESVQNLDQKVIELDDGKILVVRKVIYLYRTPEKNTKTTAYENIVLQKEEGDYKILIYQSSTKSNN